MCKNVFYKEKNLRKNTFYSYSAFQVPNSPIIPRCSCPYKDEWTFKIKHSVSVSATDVLSNYCPLWLFKSCEFTEGATLNTSPSLTQPVAPSCPQISSSVVNSTSPSVITPIWDTDCLILKEPHSQVSGQLLPLCCFKRRGKCLSLCVRLYTKKHAVKRVSLCYQILFWQAVYCYIPPALSKQYPMLFFCDVALPPIYTTSDFNASTMYKKTRPSVTEGR